MTFVLTGLHLTALFHTYGMKAVGRKKAGLLTSSSSSSCHCIQQCKASQQAEGLLGACTLSFVVSLFFHLPFTL